jgi:hypothetical protein
MYDPTKDLELRVAKLEHSDERRGSGCGAFLFGLIYSVMVTLTAVDATVRYYECKNNPIPACRETQTLSATVVRYVEAEASKYHGH